MKLAAEDDEGMDEFVEGLEYGLVGGRQQSWSGGLGSGPLADTDEISKAHSRRGERRVLEKCS